MREEVGKLVRSSHLFEVSAVTDRALQLRWNWHLDIEDALQPVAVVSQGQSLHHSE